MRTTISFEDFRDAFRAHNRIDNFSREGARILYDYLEELDPDYELDVIALCCDFCESSVAEIIEENALEIDPDDEDALAQVAAWLADQTQVLGTCDDGIVYAAF